MIHTSTLMLLGIKPVPPSLSKKGVKNARVHVSEWTTGKGSTAVELSAAQIDSLKETILVYAKTTVMGNAFSLYKKMKESNELPRDHKGREIKYKSLAKMYAEVCPEANRFDKDYRKTEAIKLFNNGLSPDEIATKMALSIGYVNVVLKNAGLLVVKRYYKRKYGLNLFNNLPASFEFTDLEQARLFQEFVYRHNSKNKDQKLATSVCQEGDIWICKVSVFEIDTVAA